METIQVKIDLITSSKDGRTWRLALVEGPWESPDTESELDRLTKRLADTVTAALDGQIADRYPDSAGKAMIIHIDSYDTPRAEVDAIVARVRATVERSSEIQAKLKEGEFISALEFEHHWFDWQDEYDKRERARRRKGGLLQWIRRLFGRVR